MPPIGSGRSIYSSGLVHRLVLQDGSIRMNTEDDNELSSLTIHLLLGLCMFSALVVVAVWFWRSL
jgi:hypothetical protein